MAQWLELDEHTPFPAQIQADDEGPVVLINKFTVPSPEVVDDFVESWRQVADLMARQPGLVSTKLHRGTVGSLTLVNVAEWESTSALRAALTTPEFQAVAQNYPDGVTTSPHIFKKVIEASPAT
jgi:heme-degrading monooxygenase HmoA